MKFEREALCLHSHEEKVIKLLRLLISPSILLIMNALARKPLNEF